MEDLLAQIPLDEQIDSVYTEMVLMTKNDAVRSLQIGKRMQ